VRVEGGLEALRELVSLARLPEQTELLGPVENGPMPGTDLPVHRVTLRCPRSAGAALVRAVQEAVAIRSARKSEGALRVVVDPISLG
jgi:primosomal protein N' (replication factor Y)